MKGTLRWSASVLALAMLPGAAWGQTTQSGSTDDQPEAEASAAREDGGTIIVTATRREERLQDVPLSVTAFGQEDLNERGVVGYEGIAQYTPGVVVNRPTQNFNNFTARGIATNGYSAGLQSAVAIYIDELPISANGNSTILDPTLFDVERVEFLRGPQGTLFGSNSLAGAMRIITRSPDLDEVQGAALVDLGLTDGALRQRYNAMINLPIVNDRLALRLVGFYRHEDGFVDNIGTGVENSNIVEAIGGRAVLLWQATDRLSLRLLASHEDSSPIDSALTNPALGTFVRRTDQPDSYTAQLTNYNLTINWDLDFAELISSTTVSTFNQTFGVDLAGTFANTIAFGLDAFAYDDLFVEEARLVSAPGGRFDWVLGFFYFDKTRETDFRYRSNPAFLQARGITGLQDQYYQRFVTDADQREIAGFGEASFRFTENFWVTAGLRYTSTRVQAFTRAGGYNSNYLVNALFGIPGPLTLTPIAAATGLPVEDDGLSYKISLSWRPAPEVTTYATVSTGFRTPVVNANAGRTSAVDPSDIVIPFGAESDSVTNYEIGAKGNWLNGRLSVNLAAYFIQWNDIQVQANRVSDTLQFATNIGGAESYGFEFEVLVRPWRGFSLAVNGSINDATVTELSPTEAAISGAVLGGRLASPHFQGSALARYDFALSSRANAFVTAAAAHVGSFPNQFPNVPGNPAAISPTFDFTDSWTNVNMTAGVNIGTLNITAYVENLFDDTSVTYVHPEAFFDSRYARLRPRTIGVRLGYNF